MEELISKLMKEVQNDPITTLNIVMAIFTVVSFTKLCSDVFSSFSCSKNRTDKINDILTMLEKVDADGAALEQEVRNLRLSIEQMENCISQIYFKVCDNEEEEEEQEEEEKEEEQQDIMPSPVLNKVPTSTPNNEQETENVIIEEPETQTQLQNQEKEQEQKQEQDTDGLKVRFDKHKQLISVLTNGDIVKLTYKKQDFIATMKVNPAAQHGYVLVSGDAEYNTPSHFSHAKKSTINPNIRSDNGWDSVYVFRGGEKRSLNDLIASVTA